MALSFAVAVDLGGTNLRVAVVDSNGNMLEKLTTGTQADRNRTAYGSSIVPDETVAGDAEVVQRAIDWLRGE